jgi:hypothetical protein
VPLVVEVRVLVDFRHDETFVAEVLDQPVGRHEDGLCVPVVSQSSALHYFPIRRGPYLQTLAPRDVFPGA